MQKINPGVRYGLRDLGDADGEAGALPEGHGHNAAWQGEISVMFTDHGRVFYDVTKIKDVTDATPGLMTENGHALGRETSSDIIVGGPDQEVNAEDFLFSMKDLGDAEGEADTRPKGMHKAAWQSETRYALKQSDLDYLRHAALSQPIALAEYGMAGQPGSGCTIRVP